MDTRQMANRIGTLERFQARALRRESTHLLWRLDRMQTIHMLWQSSGVSVIVLKNAWRSFYAWASKVPD
jgi:hypothetical protein